MMLMEKKKKIKYADLSGIMHPSSVAIIGASENPDKVGHVILQNYIDAGYPGKIYPINISSFRTNLTG